MLRNSKYKVVIAQRIAEDGINILRYNSNIDVVLLDKSERDKLRQEITKADAIIVRSRVEVNEELLSYAENLKIVGRAGTGYDNIDVNACSKRGIIVLIATGGNINAVIELTIGLMFSSVRYIPRADRTMKEGKWEKSKLRGTELNNKTVGLIGLGKIGGRVAEICQSLGMNVLALVKNRKKKRKIMFRGHFVDSLEELLPDVDLLSIHAPLNEETIDMIGEKEFLIMKSTAYIINTARGGIVNEKSFI